MKCPVCQDSQLTMSERQNVEIDYCPNCRGVWLDRGELDKIIERSTPIGQPHNPSQSGRTSDSQQRHNSVNEQGFHEKPSSDYYGKYRDDHRKPSHHYHGKPHKKKKVSSFLEDLFDF